MSNQTPGRVSSQPGGPRRGPTPVQFAVGLIVCVICVIVQQTGLIGGGRAGVGGNGAEAGGSAGASADRPQGDRGTPESRLLGGDDLLKASREHRSDVLVRAAGRVKKVLADDTLGVQHQRFIVTLGNGLTVLIAHNLELSTRVPVKEGSGVEFKGEYEWNDQGGIVHWTHRDPGKRHADGWIKFDGKTYQ